MAARTRTYYLDAGQRRRRYQPEAPTTILRAVSRPPRRRLAYAAYTLGAAWFAATLLVLAITRGELLWP